MNDDKDYKKKIKFLEKLNMSLFKTLKEVEKERDKYKKIHAKRFYDQIIKVFIMNDLQKIRYDHCIKDNQMLQIEIADKNEEIQRLKDVIFILEQKLEQFEDDI